MLWYFPFADNLLKTRSVIDLTQSSPLAHISMQVSGNFASHSSSIDDDNPFEWLHSKRARRTLASFGADDAADFEMHSQDSPSNADVRMTSPHRRDADSPQTIAESRSHQRDASTAMQLTVLDRSLVHLAGLLDHVALTLAEQEERTLEYFEHYSNIIQTWPVAQPDSYAHALPVVDAEQFGDREVAARVEAKLKVLKELLGSL